MRVRIDRGSGVPESEQLRRKVAGLIERGTLGPGERLPPVRALAEQLGLAVNTVAKAYRELEDAELVIARGRLGTFVADSLPKRPPAAEARLSEAAETYAARARQLGFGPSDALEQARRALNARRGT
jgi:DNA-binding transcriptional regulator YhcF (GntR family)